MGVGTFAYAMDLDRLRAAFGSKDSGLADAVASRFAEQIASYDEHAAEGEPRVREALDDIIAGEIRRPDRDVSYTWAADLLCRHLGEELELGDVGWLDELELETGLEGSGPPLPIPRRQDSPLLSFLTADQVARAHERLQDEDLSRDDEDLEEEIETLVSWLGEAARRGLALVTLTQG